MNPAPALRYEYYCRVARDDEQDPGDSESQTERCRAIIEAHGFDTEIFDVDVPETMESA